MTGPDTGVLIEARDLAVGYSGQPILEGIDFAIERGRYVGIIGPNGGGKTTLLRTILGLLPVVAGRLVVALVERSRECSAGNSGRCTPDVE